MELICKKCGCREAHKSGIINGIQRYKCKQCGHQYTKITPQGKPIKDKMVAMLLYFSGLSMNATAKIIGVTAQSVMRWIRQFQDEYAAEIPSEPKIKEVSLDELSQYFQKMTKEYKCKKLLIAEVKTAAGRTLNIVLPKR